MLGCEEVLAPPWEPPVNILDSTSSTDWDDLDVARQVPQGPSSSPVVPGNWLWDEFEKEPLVHPASHPGSNGVESAQLLEPPKSEDNRDVLSLFHFPLEEEDLPPPPIQDQNNDLWSGGEDDGSSSGRSRKSRGRRSRRTSRTSTTASLSQQLAPGSSRESELTVSSEEESGVSDALLPSAATTDPSRPSSREGRRRNEKKTWGLRWWMFGSSARKRGGFHLDAEKEESRFRALMKALAQRWTNYCVVEAIDPPVNSGRCVQLLTRLFYSPLFSSYFYISVLFVNCWVLIRGVFWEEVDVWLALAEFFVTAMLVLEVGLRLFIWGSRKFFSRIANITDLCVAILCVVLLFASGDLWAAVEGKRMRDGPIDLSKLSKGIPVIGPVLHEEDKVDILQQGVTAFRLVMQVARMITLAVHVRRSQTPQGEVDFSLSLEEFAAKSAV